ncbi:MAG TPA: translation initiation factor IF-3 [Candidatus Hydromicrobium sp.]
MIYLPIFFQKLLWRCNFEDNRRIHINEQIRVPDVRLIAEDGSQIGVIPVKEALKTAEERGLDLVEVSPKSNPPVCKIMDYGKYKYQLEISEKLKKKKQSQIIVKEIKLRPKIDTNDLNTKKRQIEKFLKSGYKVKITVMFRGREIVHKELGINMLNKLIEELKDKGVMELEPKLDGYNIITILAPV